MPKLRIMDNTGDSTLDFSQDNAESLALAQDVIDRALAKGSAVFKVDPKTKEAEKITKAEQVGEEALVVPALTAG